MKFARRIALRALVTAVSYFVKYDVQSRQRPLQSFWATVDLTKRFNLCILWTFLIIFITTWNWYLVFTSWESKIYFWHGKLQLLIMYSIVLIAYLELLMLLYTREANSLRTLPRVLVCDTRQNVLYKRRTFAFLFYESNWFLEYWRSCS